MELFVLCIIIFFGRILDVSLSTVKTVLIMKNRPVIATIFSLIEISVWFLVVREALTRTEGIVWIAIAYAAGFAIGTYVGSIIATKSIKGTVRVQVITTNDDEKIIETIREKGFAVTVVSVRGKDKIKEKFMLYIEVNNKSLKCLKQLIKTIDPQAFIVVNETKFVQNGFIK